MEVYNNLDLGLSSKKMEEMNLIPKLNRDLPVLPALPVVEKSEKKIGKKKAKEPNAKKPAKKEVDRGLASK